MFRYTPHRPTTVRKNSFRPALESLESRDCPSAAPSINLMVVPALGERMVTLTGHVTDEVQFGRTVTFTGQYNGTAVTNLFGDYSVTVQAAALGSINATTTDPEGQASNTAVGQVTSVPPSITNFMWFRIGNLYTFTGTVMDEAAGGRTVTFGGLPSLQGVTATTNFLGLFTKVVVLGPGEGGTATAQTTDCWGLASSVAQTTVTPAPNSAPNLTFNITPGTQKNVTLSGQVSDENPGGITVVFSGQYSGTAVTNSSGAYSITVEAAGLGTIGAQASDAQGLGSNVVQRTVISNAPVIHNFSATRTVNNIYLFTGSVMDESFAGLTLNFGGLDSLIGRTTTVNYDGTFSLAVELDPGEVGCATALTTDWWGLVSQIAETLVV